METGGVTGVYLPNVTVNTATGEPTVTDVSGLTYADIAIAGGGSVSPDVSLPDGVLEGLQSIISLLTQTFDVVTSIPPFLQAELESGVIIDIPTTLNDILGVVDGIPQSLDDLLDGVTIDIPGAIDDAVGAIIDIPAGINSLIGPVIGGISTGVTGLQGTLSQVLSGVTALPASIAGALDLDWLLDNVGELNLELPNLAAPIVLPQATFEDVKSVLGEYRDRTPLGKIFEVYEDSFDVMSEEPSGAPRYEITFPPPINYTFIIDFSVFDGRFVQLAHAFFYLLAIFWYLKFLKTVRGWVSSWMAVGGSFAEVARQESYGFME